MCDAGHLVTIIFFFGCFIVTVWDVFSRDDLNLVFRFEGGIRLF